MKQILLFIATLLPFFGISQTPDLDWANQLGGSSNDEGKDILLTTNDSVVILARSAETTINVDPGAGTNNLTLDPNNDYFLAKYSSSGVLGWGFTIPAKMRKITLDANNNIYVAGTFSGTVDFDPSAGTSSLTAIGTKYDIFIAKYDPQGTIIWAQQYAADDDVNPDYSGVGIKGIKVVNTDIYISGAIWDTADFDPGAAVHNLHSTCSEYETSDIFIAKYDLNGDFVWANSFGADGAGIFGNSFTVDNSGNSYVTGDLVGVIDFNPASGSTIDGGNMGSGYLAKYATNGDLVWVKLIEGTGWSSFQNLVLNTAQNEIYTSISYGEGDSDADPSASSYPLTETANRYSAAICKYDSDGQLVWVKETLNTTADGLEPYHDILAVDDQDNFLVATYLEAGMSFDYNGQSDVFSTWDRPLSIFNSSGELIWNEYLGEVNTYYDAAVFNGLSLYTTGSFENSQEFDFSTSSTTLTSAGQSDIFMAKYTFPSDLGFESNDIIVSSYPNPSNGLVTITLNQTETLDYELFSMDGKLINTQKNISTTQFKIDLSNQAYGVYWLKIGTQNGTKTIQLVKH